MLKSTIAKKLAKSVSTFYKKGNTNKDVWQLEATIADPKLIKALRKLIVDVQEDK